MTANTFRLYGIFGFPLTHTLSPVMHEAAFSAVGGPASRGRTVGIKAFYLPFEVRREEFHPLMHRMRDLLLDGFNVTVPYKEEILRHLDKLSPSARAIGAVNTVVRKGKQWVGFNTDETGFIASLEREGKFQPRGKEILILGAGGSARAVAYGLARRKAARIVIANRTLARAKRIVSEYKKLFPRVQWENGSNSSFEMIRTMDLVVNATSVGLKANDPSLVSPRDFPKKTFFVDLIYNPRETKFLRLAKESGRRTQNGLGMLVYQGAEAFRLWTGRKAPVEAMRAVLTQRGAHGR